MRRYFDFAATARATAGRPWRGSTTFLTMAYIIVVNPAILEAAGIPRGPSVTATILSAAFGTTVMGLYAKRPFAIAPYMGENAFIAYTVVKAMGYSWQTALGAIFLVGVLFTVLTVFRIRSWLTEAIPLSLKHSFAVGIGLFLTFIGLNETGFVALGVPGAPVALGNIGSPATLLAVLGFLLIAWMLARRVPGALFVGILATTALSMAAGVAPLPAHLVSLPPSLSPILGRLDIAAALSPKALPVVLTSSSWPSWTPSGPSSVSGPGGAPTSGGTCRRLKSRCSPTPCPPGGPPGRHDDHRRLLESAAGIAEGGRTGFTSLVVAALFLLSISSRPCSPPCPPRPTAQSSSPSGST